MAIFKKELLAKVLDGSKVQTRRAHKHLWKVGKAYSARCRWFTKTEAKILILRRFRQRLDEISQEDVKKEGYQKLEDYQKAWKEFYGEWSPEQVVTVYEFKLLATKSEVQK